MAIVAYLAAFIFFAFIFQQGFLTTMDYWPAGQTSPGFVQSPSWVTQIFMPLGIGLIALRIAYRFLVLCRSFALKDYGLVKGMEYERADSTEAGPDMTEIETEKNIP